MRGYDLDLKYESIISCRSNMSAGYDISWLMAIFVAWVPRDK